MNQAVSPANMRQVDLREGYVDAINSLQTGTYKGSGDVIDYSLYDRIDMLSTRLQHHMFQIGIGQNDPAGVVKTGADTNVQGAQGVPVGQKLYVNALKVMYTSTAATVTAAILNAFQEMVEQTTLAFNITGKANYGIWKLNEIFGVPLQMALEPAALGSLFPASNGRFLGIYPLNLPIVLAQQVQFEVFVEHHVAPAAALDGDFMSCSLCGILERLS